MSKDAEKAASKVFFDGQVRIGAIAGHVGKNQWQLEFHPPEKAFVDECRLVRSRRALAV